MGWTESLLDSAKKVSVSAVREERALFSPLKGEHSHFEGHRIMNKENAVLSRTKMLFRCGMENMVWMAATRTISYGANLYVDGLQMYYVMHIPLLLESLWPFVMMLLLHKSLFFISKMQVICSSNKTLSYRYL